MTDQIYIGNFAKGLILNREPYNIDNDAFPTVQNSYIWRGDAKRKRGTSKLARFQRQVSIVVLPTTNWEYTQIALVAGAKNLITGFSLQANSSITPGSISLTVNASLYTDPAKDGNLLKAGVADAGSTINYATGVLTIAGGAGNFITGTFSYFPDLPVLGLEDFVSNSSDTEFPLLLAFDTTYSYQVNQGNPRFFYSTSYYKNSNNPVLWSNFDYAQFWSTNYQSAFWVTNNKPGLHVLSGTYIAGTGSATITFHFTSSGDFTTLVIGDVLWFNEWTTAGTDLNGVQGVVSDITNKAVGQYIVTFTQNQIVGGTGFVIMLTNSLPGQDGIKWYDGDPTSGTGFPTGTPAVPPNTSNVGWVNFCPPLTAFTVSINDQTSEKYYLVGALMILPFKDRLLFFGPMIQKIGGSVVTRPLQDSVIWSWNGTPFYSVSKIDLTVPNVPVYTPGLVPLGETADPTSYYVDVTGKGGWQSAGISKPIKTAIPNGDVILTGFGGSGKKTRFVYTGDGIQPFLFYIINSELPSTSTFSSIIMDDGGIEIGSYGITITTQQGCDRIDVVIPDTIFEIQNINNGLDRITAIRDFFREWIYFSYPIGNGDATESSWKYPIRSLLYNYRDNTWAIMIENYTHHGVFRAATNSQFTWATCPFPTWTDWNEPWNSTALTELYASVVSGNPQGYVVISDEGTGETPSGYIAALANNGNGFTRITSPNHCLEIGQYLLITGALGILSSSITGITLSTTFTIITTVNTFIVGQIVKFSGVVGTTQLNGNSYTIFAATGANITLQLDSSSFGAWISGGTVTFDFNNLIGMVIATTDANTFDIDLKFPPNTYMGAGEYTRLSNPLLVTKAFNDYWKIGRKIRLGNQKYLMNTTSDGQLTVNIYLSQDVDNSYNRGPINPISSPNNSLIYSQLLYTCPESTNIGLTPANMNLQMPTALSQNQIWHRINTSLIGDSIQIGFTLSDAQMRNLDYATAEIVVQGIQFGIDPGPQLS